MDNKEFKDGMTDLNDKLDALLEKVNELKIVSARLDERMTALKASVDEGKDAAQAHYANDEVRFSGIENKISAYRGAVKVWLWIIAVVAAIPSLVTHLLLHK